MEGAETPAHERGVIPRERKRPRDLAREWLVPFMSEIPRFARDEELRQTRPLASIPPTVSAFSALSALSA
jgi:hypothetical protein